MAERIGTEVPLLKADVTDAASIREMAESAKVVITTVGPYINYGEALVEACAAAGTDYVDLTGEPLFVDLMYIRHHATAEASGARIIHCCGFDSIPHDLGAQFTVEQLPEGVPLEVNGFVRAGGRPSGGTVHSAMAIASKGRESLSVARERRKLEPRPANRRIAGGKPRPRHEAGVGWAMPMPTVDPQIVKRSASALDRYGPDFTYGHFFAVKQLPLALGAVAGFSALGIAAQIPPARNFILGRIDPGEGPSEERRAKSWFNVRFHGEGGGQRVACEVKGGDPGYGETSKMLAESALCLALDDGLPEVSGQVTTAQAMGSALRERLQRAGMGFDVVPYPA